MSLTTLQNYYKTFLTKEPPEESAIKEAREEGFEDFESAEASGMKRANKILEAIKRKNSYKDSLEEKFEASEEKMADVQKQFPPALASLMAAAAGWAFSGDVGRAGQMTEQQAREWERNLSAAERRKVERSMRSKMRRKSVDKTLDKSTFDALKESYNDSSDEYIKRSPEKNDFLVIKDHSILPPRQGLMWDALKHRWTRPENVGHTVTEVQGKKRMRGTGTGAHERSVAGHGRGKTRGVEAGRRFKGQSDVGALRPHEGKHPAGHAKHKKT